MSNEKRLRQIGMKDPRRAGIEIAELVAEGPGNESQFHEALELFANGQTKTLWESGLFKDGYIGLYRSVYVDAAKRRWAEMDGEGLAIHPDCPPGVMVMGKNGRPAFTHHGLGVMMGTRAIEEEGNEATALASVPARLDHADQVMRDDGYAESIIAESRTIKERSAIMKIREHFHATGQAGGEA